MKNYVRIASASPKLKIGDPIENKESIKSVITELNDKHVKVCVFPRFTLTSLSLADAFFDEDILAESNVALWDIVDASKGKDILIALPHHIKYHNKIVEIASFIRDGKIIGMVQNNNKDKYNEEFAFNEDSSVIIIEDLDNHKHYIPASSNLVIELEDYNNIKVGIDFSDNNISKANIILNPHNVEETVNIGDVYHRYKNKSRDRHNIYAVASPSFTESTAYDVYNSRSFIYEGGVLLDKIKKMSEKYVIADIDLDIIEATDKTERVFNINEITSVKFNNVSTENIKGIERPKDRTPYIDKTKKAYEYSMHIINILAIALLKRANVSHSKSLVLGISGGLDSAMAALIIKRAKELSETNDDIKKIEKLIFVTMPSYGSSEHTRGNAHILSEALGVSAREINIKEATDLHLRDINHDINNQNVTYENAQARERTQILFDIANDEAGIVVGTGDMSEIALGWSTYNGDQMSNYNVNASLPKTLIRYIISSIVEYNTANKLNEKLTSVLKSIVDTPVSPELLSSQETESILGPYEVIDFVMYYYLNYHFGKDKITELAKDTFVDDNIYSLESVNKAIESFFSRIYKNQYKREAAPASPHIGIMSLDSRDSFKLPSDMER